MPSRIGLPVFLTQSSKTGAGSVSPADTAMRSDDRSGSLVHGREHGAVCGRRGEADRRSVTLDDLDHVGRGGVLQKRRGGTEAQRKDRQPAQAEGEGERRRADEDIVGGDVQHLLRIAVGDDQQVAVEVHGRLGHAGRSRGEGEQRDVVAAGRHGLEADRLVERDTVELGIVVGGAVEADHLLEEPAVLGAGDQLVHQPRVAEGERDLGLVDDLRELLRAQHGHGVDDDRAGFCGGQPAGDHGGVVGRTDEHAASRLDAIGLDKRMGEPVGPVGQLLVGSMPPVADQRGAIAETRLDHPIGELDAGIDALGVVEPVQQEVGALLRRGKVVARERVGMCAGSQHHAPPITCLAITTFCTSDAPS